MSPASSSRAVANLHRRPNCKLDSISTPMHAALFGRPPARPSPCVAGRPLPKPEPRVALDQVHPSRASRAAVATPPGRCEQGPPVACPSRPPPLVGAAPPLNRCPPPSSCHAKRLAVYPRSGLAWVTSARPEAQSGHAGPEPLQRAAAARAAVLASQHQELHIPPSTSVGTSPTLAGQDVTQLQAPLQRMDTRFV